MQAMILAAGLGMRLRPLTANCPKPLIKVAGKPLLDYHLERLAALGVTDIIINVSYLGSQVQAYCGDGSRYGVRITYSPEPDGPLGVLGGVRLAMERGLQGQFLLVSADIWLDILPSHPFLKTPFQERLLVIPKPHRYEKGDFGLDEMGRLTIDDPNYTYAGMAFLEAKLFEEPLSSFADLLKHQIQKQLMRAMVYEGAYFNVGTLEELTAVEAYLASN